ncbi:MAG: hypothetical protein ACR5LD_07460 [Symbiopectobacterium sp.]
MTESLTLCYPLLSFSSSSAKKPGMTAEIVLFISNRKVTIGHLDQ